MVLPRYAAKTDDNQQEIIDALRKIGCSVVVIGTPVDLLVGRGGRNFLFECKNPATDYGKNNRSTPTQTDFISSWKGQISIVTSAEQAIAIVST